jgi:hypothetical protein
MNSVPQSDAASQQKDAVSFASLEKTLDHIVEHTEASETETTEPDIKRKFQGYCPAHKDHDPSLSISLKEDKILLYCHACGVEKTNDICEALRITEAQLFANHYSITVVEFAKEKRLPERSLVALCGLQDSNPPGKYISIPYPDEAGLKPVWNRKRYPGKKFPCDKKANPVLYGLPVLKHARKQGQLVIVEGESDCWTLWHHQIPAVGVPSATMAKKVIKAAHLAGIPHVYLHREPDRGGDKLVKDMAEHRQTLDYQGEVKVFSCPGFKDPSEMHIALVDRLKDEASYKKEFKEQLDKALGAARPIDEVVKEIDAATGKRQSATATDADVVQEDDYLETLADVAETYQPLEYFWYPWIPYSEITIVNGDSGVGKSYANCAVAAYRAMGIPLPCDDRPYPPIRSLIINNEDHNDRIFERMQSLPIKVDLGSGLIQLWKEDWKPFHANNAAHIKRLEKMIEEKGIQALWLDSLESILHEVDINRDVEVIPKLRMLLDLAKRYKIPVVINHHLNSTVGVKATQRSRGSKQIIAVSRSTLTFDKLYGEDPTERAISHAKVNYAPEAKTLTFHIVPHPDRKAAFKWGSVKDITADQLMNQKVVGENELKEDHYRTAEYLVEKGDCQWLRLNVISAAFPHIPKPHLSGRILKLLRTKGYVDWREGGEYRANEKACKLVRGEL